jgi:hypothetical protein
MSMVFQVGDKALIKEINNPCIIKNKINKNIYTVMDKNGCLYNYCKNQLDKRNYPMYNIGDSVGVIHKQSRSKINYNDDINNLLKNKETLIIKKITNDYYTLVDKYGNEWDAYEDQLIDLNNFNYNYIHNLKNKILEQERLINYLLNQLVK